ncbi:nuclear condensing complex subunit [Tribonema minus]|uniref:Nuclear condensing complex subunit n=1 Tax=Tribonema minus TaxID=303371 RepID=A0A835YU77_9STRA|nr:nuclear condensing complex subunit [Tribonema minus]
MGRGKENEDSDTSSEESEEEGDQLTEMRPNVPEAVAAFRKLFADAQRSTANHTRCAAALRRALSARPALTTELFACIDRVLTVFKREPAAERLVAFIARAACLPGGDEGDVELAAFVLEFLVSRAGAPDRAARLRACHITAAVLEGLGADADIAEDLWQAVTAAMAARVSDKVPAVRAAACAALLRLQYAEAAGGCAATAALLRAARADASKDVRKAAMQSLQISKAVLPDIMRRTRDTSEDVRRTAYQVLADKAPLVYLTLPQRVALVLADKVPPVYLTVPQRVALVEWGLKDRSPAVVAACRGMVCRTWLRGAGGAVPLLGLLDVIQFEDAAESVLKTLLETGLAAERGRSDAALSALGLGLSQEDAAALRNVAATRVNFAEGLTPESALFARVQAEVVTADAALSAADREERLGTILPETPHLCAFVEAVAQQDGLQESLGQLFILQQMLKMARMVDFSEEAGRHRLVTLLRALLLDPFSPSDLVEVAMRALASANPSKGEFVRVVAELISDLSESPNESESLNDSDDAPDSEEDGGVRGPDADGGEEEEERRVMRQVRSLEMVTVLLEHTTRTLADGTLASLDMVILPAVRSPHGAPVQDMVILPAVRSPHGAVREYGLAALGKYALLGEEAARANRLLLVAVAGNTAEELPVRGNALQTVQDLALIFGDAVLDLALVFGDVVLAPDGGAALRLIARMLSAAATVAGDAPDDDNFNDAEEEVNPAMAAIAAEGCAKLLFARRVADPALLARLLAMYFTPGSPADPATLSRMVQQEERDESDYAGFTWQCSTALAPERDESDYAGVEGFESLDQAYTATALGSPVRLQQVLATFFPCFAAAGGDARAALSAAVPLALAQLGDAERDGDGEVEVPVHVAARFMVSLLAMGDDGDSSGGATAAPHDDGDPTDEDPPAATATTITSASAQFAAVAHVAACACAALLRVADSVALGGLAQRLCKAAATLTPPPAAAAAAAADGGSGGDEARGEATKLVLVLAAAAQRTVKDKTCLKQLEKLSAAWSTMDAQPGAPLPHDRLVTLAQQVGTTAATLARYSKPLEAPAAAAAAAKAPPAARTSGALKKASSARTMLGTAAASTKNGRGVAAATKAKKRAPVAAESSSEESSEESSSEDGSSSSGDDDDGGGDAPANAKRKRGTGSKGRVAAVARGSGGGGSVLSDIANYA